MPIPPSIVLPYISPSYPRYGTERINWWNNILQRDIVADKWFKKWYWDITEGVDPISTEKIDAYVFEHYAEELKKPEIMARILGDKDYK